MARAASTPGWYWIPLYVNDRDIRERSYLFPMARPPLDRAARPAFHPSPARLIFKVLGEPALKQRSLPKPIHVRFV